MKLFIASCNRASDFAISKLKKKLQEEDMVVEDYKDATHILVVGDRTETFDFVLRRFREHYPIIHLWAGESSDWNTNDEVYRTAITLMSRVQLCTNQEAKERVTGICNSVNKEHNAFVIGNVMLDNLEINETDIPPYPYILILYNPIMSKDDVLNDIQTIHKFIKNKQSKYIWIETNGDENSDLVNSHVTHKNIQRNKFLGLIKNCDYFLTNSSCGFYEAPFIINKKQIVWIGNRNKNRESKNANMEIKDATNNIIRILKTLK